MTSSDRCAASCVYGRCRNPAADDVITCACFPGYTGDYCHLLDKTRITVTSLSDGALLNFTHAVKIESTGITVKHYNDELYIINSSNSIAVRNLQASTEYEICMVSIFNNTDTTDDILRTENNTDVSGDIKPESVCITVMTKDDYSAIYVRLAISSVCLICSIVALLFLCRLVQCLHHPRDLTFYNIAQTDDSKLEETIYKIFEKNLEISGARQILLQGVYRRRVRFCQYLPKGNPNAVDVYFDSADDRDMVLKHAQTSNKVTVDGKKIILPPESECEIVLVQT